MELFSLFGTISVKYADAVEEIDKVTKSAKGAGEELDNMGESAEKSEKPIEDSGESAKDADGKFSSWSVTLANLVANGIQKVIDKCVDLARDVIDLGTDFTATMSEVQAISGATDEELATLEQTARQFGASTVFSANDAAQALKYMSLAGWTAEESATALGGVLDLAAASGMELASASDMVTDYLSAFGMSAEQSAYFADMLAFAQSNSNTTAEQLGEAYRNCAANLNAAGQDAETVTAMLEAMANQGYKGSEAGTALTATMRDITSRMFTMEKATDAARYAEEGFNSITGDMTDLIGVNTIAIGDMLIPVEDANHNFRDLTDILQDVETATNGMGDAQRASALSATFTADSTKAMNLLLNEGMANVADYELALRGAEGAAADMAATMNDNLKGDLAAMHSAFDELKLKIFDGAESPLRGLVQFVTDRVVPMLTNLVENFDKIAPVLAGVTAALVTCKTAMMISGIVDALVKSFQAYQLANEGATVAQWLMNAAMMANPIVLIVTLIAGLIAALVVLWNTNEDFRNGVIAAWESVKEGVAAAIDAVVGFFQKAWDFLEGYGEYLYDWVQGIVSGVKNFFISIGTAVGDFFQTVWNAIQVGFLFIVELVKTYIQLVTLPWRFLWENCKEYLIAAWEAIKSAVSAALSNVKKAIDTISGTIQTVFTGIRDFVKTIFDTVRSHVETAWNACADVVTAYLNAIWNVIMTIFNAVRDFITSILNSIRDFFVNIWNTITDKVTTAVTNLRDKVRTIFESVRSVISDKLTSAKNTVVNIFDNIRNSVQTKIEAARDFVKNAIDRIKSFFNFSWSLPKLKLPHFKISGSFSLDPPSVPSFGIDWYAKGGIMQQPTVFGFNPATGRAQVGGEAGAEAVAPIDTLLGYIRTAVQEENTALAEKVERIIMILDMYFPRLIAAIPKDVVLDSGAIVGELAPEMNDELGGIGEDEKRWRG